MLTIILSAAGILRPTSSVYNIIADLLRGGTIIKEMKRQFWGKAAQ
jgi:hypothetical protein